MTLQREHAIQAVRASLLRRASPRMQMLGLVMATSGTGFVASYALLHAGIRSMALRYPLAVGIGYVAFLGLVWVWLRRYRLNASITRERNRNHLHFDVTQQSFDQLFSPAPPMADHFDGFGGGGEFSGSGGGSDWADGPTSFHAVSAASSPGLGGGSTGDGGLDLDWDEGALWLIPVALIAAVVFCVVAYVLLLAPTLFAELLLDVGLAAGLYRRLLRSERRSWLVTAVRSTVVPVCLVAALLALAGTIMQGVYPDVASIGAVVQHLQAPPAVLNTAPQTLPGRPRE